MSYCSGTVTHKSALPSTLSRSDPSNIDEGLAMERLGRCERDDKGGKACHESHGRPVSELNR